MLTILCLFFMKGCPDTWWIVIVTRVLLSRDSEIRRAIQWDHSKAETYGTEIFVYFRQVSILEWFEMKRSQI